MIEALNFPKADLKLKKIDGQINVWCVIRKKFLVCTPEEWVRQHTIHYLLHHKNIALGRIASEYRLEYNGLDKRADIVVFDEHGRPQLLVECKATSVKLDESTLFQAAQYNHALNIEYLILTNGLEHIVVEVEKETGKLNRMNDIPSDL